jgi:hypothetical protein
VTRDVQLPEPAALLLEAATRATPRWLRRIVADAITASGWSSERSAAGADGTVETMTGEVSGDVSDETPDEPLFGTMVDVMVERETRRVLEALVDLLATDVDEQRTNPLSVFRDAVAGPTDVLRRLGVPPPVHDPFASRAFPDDVYRLGPATWSDIDPELHEPGLVWGAWKAMTVLRRRREEGSR